MGYIVNKVVNENRYGGGVSVKLSPDQSINPFTWSAPILWTGYLSGKEVSFNQTQNQAYSVSCFDWDGFPEEYNHLKPAIAKLIDNELRSMN